MRTFRPTVSTPGDKIWFPFVSSCPDELGENLVPFASELTSDRRCHLIKGDFFAMVADSSGFGPYARQRCHAILVDIDHTPRHLLHASHARFYGAAGLRRLADCLHPGGVFGLWSDGAPDAEFIAVVGDAFASCVAHVVTFPNFYTGEESASTVYVAEVGSG